MVEKDEDIGKIRPIVFSHEVGKYHSIGAIYRKSI